MKNLPPPQLCRSLNSVNRTQDVWIEAYLEALERWRCPLAQLRPVRNAYGKYRASGEAFFRWLAWDAVQKAAATLAYSAPIASKEGVR